MNNRLNAKERAHLARVKACAIDGCGNQHLARGYCQKHYMQLRRSGDERVAPRTIETDGEYINRRVVKTEAGCWEWQGSKFFGYGRLVKRGKSWPAHAFSYMVHVGPIPDGKQINHKCHNRACLNPDHLYAGTQKENMRDMREAGRSNYLRGESDGNSKITADVARAIYSHEGIAREAADKYGVSVSLVYAIKKRQVWRHIHE